MLRKGFFALAAFSLLAISTGTQAADYVITLDEHQFTPAKLTVPAGQTIKLTVKNEQPTPAEFESAQLDREKVVEPGSSIVLILGPLDAGDYPYFDDFHRDSMGVITAK